MSTCPELDLISVYLDEELPRQYEQKLEKHIETCAECQAVYKTFKDSSNILQQDARNIFFSDKQLDESFLRLKTKMNYHAVTQSNNFGFSRILKWAMPVVTATAVLLAVVLPIRAVKQNSVPVYAQQFYSPIKATAISNIQNIPSLLHEAGVAKEASLYTRTPVSTIEEKLTTATIDIFRPELSETIRISINLNGFANFNSQTPYEDVILPASFTVDVQN